MRCFTWENFMEYYYERNIDIFDQVISEIFIAVKKHKMSLYSQLFPVRPGGGTEVWGGEGRPVGVVENYQMQSFFQRRIRSGSMKVSLQEIEGGLFWQAFY